MLRALHASVGGAHRFSDLSRSVILLRPSATSAFPLYSKTALTSQAAIPLKQDQLKRSLHVTAVQHARIRRQVIIPPSDTKYHDKDSFTHSTDKVTSRHPSNSTHTHLTPQQRKAALDLDRITDDVLSSMYDHQSSKNQSSMDVLVQPKAKSLKPVDGRHAAVDALDEQIQQEIADSIGEPTIDDDNAAKRRVAVMDLYDVRHEYVSDERTQGDVPEGTIAQVGRGNSFDSLSDTGDDWFTNVAHNVPVSYIKDDASVPRWLRGVETAQKRQAGELETEMDELSEMNVDGQASPKLMLKHVLQVISDERGQNLVVIDVRDKCDHTDYMVIVEGRSSKQIYTIADTIRRKVKHMMTDNSSLPDHLVVQGSDSEDWMVVDLGGVLVNCFTPEARQFYDLDRLWLFMDSSRLSEDFALEADELRDSL
ncbi:iojap-like ribosome-associated protein [Batrachochytrium salamandrivorans]|nr:iojap-like ribosome-associated protein [Batrachochytrium salamandrivorans]